LTPCDPPAASQHRHSAIKRYKISPLRRALENPAHTAISPADPSCRAAVPSAAPARCLAAAWTGKDFCYVWKASAQKKDFFFEKKKQKTFAPALSKQT
jgi:hypothetical protein